MIFPRLFGSLVDRVLCVAGAILFSQGPEFMQQYLQRLGGHLQEARRQLDSFHAAAAQANLPFARFVEVTRTNPDPGISRLGTVMNESAERVTRLQVSHDSLLQASDWMRPFAFARHADPQIVRATAAVFRPAVPTTLEGAIYAGVGMLTLLGLYHLGLRTLLALVRRRPSRPPSPRAA